MKREVHHIDNSIIAFNYESQEAASRCNVLIESIINSHIIPELEIAIENIIPGGVNIELPKVEINIGKIREKDIKNQLAQHIRKSLEAELRKNLEKQFKENSIYHDNDGVTSQFLVGAVELYMKKGFFPIWLEKNLSLEQLLSLVLLQSSNDLIKLLRTYRGDDVGLKRIAYHISTELFNKLLKKMDLVDYDWILLFNLALLNLRQPKKEWITSKEEILKKIQFFTLSYLLRNENSFHKDQYAEHILSSIIKIVAIDFPLFSTVNKIKKEVSSIEEFINKTFSQLIKKAIPPSSVFLNVSQRASLENFIVKINAEKANLSIVKQQFPKHQIIDFISINSSRELLVRLLSLNGLRNIVKLFHSKDSTDLIEFIKAFQQAFLKSKNSKVGYNKHGIESLTLMTIRFLHSESNFELNYQTCFSFLTAWTRNEAIPLKNESLDVFLKKQTKVNRKQLEQLTVKSIDSKWLESFKLQYLSDFKSDSIISPEIARKDPAANLYLDIYKKELLVYYLDHGYLPSKFRKLNITDIQRLLFDLVAEKDVLLAHKIKAGSGLNYLFVESDTLVKYLESKVVLGVYLTHFFSKSFQAISVIILDLKERFEVVSKGVFELNRNLSILKILIASKGQINPSLFYFHIAHELMHSLEFKTNDSKQIIHYLLKKVQSTKVKIGRNLYKSSDLESEARIKRQIKLDYRYIINLLEQDFVNGKKERSFKSYIQKLELYIIIYPELLIAIVREEGGESLIDMLKMLKFHLAKDTIKQLQNLFKKDTELNTVMHRWIKETYLSGSESEKLNEEIRFQIKNLNSHDSDNLNTTLSLILSDENYFDIFLDTVNNRIPIVLKIEPKTVYATLNALLSFKISADINLPSKFWKSLILKFAIKVAISDKSYSNLALSKYFLSHLKASLNTINKGEQLDQIIISLKLSNLKEIRQITYYLLKNLRSTEMKTAGILSQSGDLGSDTQIKRQIKLDYHYLINLLERNFDQEKRDQPFKSYLQKLELYIKTYPEFLISIIKEYRGKSILDNLKVLKFHLPEDTIERLENLFEKDTELDTIMHRLMHETYLSGLESAKLNEQIRFRITNLNSQDSDSFNNTLSLILSDQAYFDIFLDTVHDKIPIVLKIEPKSVYATLNALFNLKLSADINLPSKFWKSLVLKFSIKIASSSRSYSNLALSKHFISHLMAALNTIDKGEQFDQILISLKLSKLQEIETLFGKNSSIFNPLLEFKPENNFKLSGKFWEYIFLKFVRKIETPNNSYSKDIVNSDARIIEKVDKDALKKSILSLAFYGRYGFLPWWFEKISFYELILRLRVWMDLQPVEFEALFLKVEQEEDFMEKLLLRLPSAICLEFEQLLAGRKTLQNLFDKRKLSSRNNGKIQSKLKWQDFEEEKLIAKGIEKSSLQDSELLNKALYFLSDEEILKKWLLEKPKIKKQITSYLQLTPYCYFKELNPEKWRRIVYHFALEFFKDDASTLKESFDEKFVLHLKNDYKNIPWKNLFKSIYEKMQSSRTAYSELFPVPLMEFVNLELNDQQESDKIVSNKSIKDKMDQPIEVNIYNAGLILVWPFLVRLFEQLSLVKNNSFVNKESKVRGVYILQHMVFNNVTAPEHELVLNKILVGLHLEEHFNPFVNLSREEKEMARSLIKGLIHNWGKVGDSSVEAIQETFFQRSGILRLREENITLIIEKKGVDVLLESISWNITLIKLPWMERPIHVEWI